MKRIEMSQAEFAEHAEAFFQEKVLPLLQKKGQQYSDGDNAFHNFESGSKMFDGVTPQKYLMVMATKHWQNLCQLPEHNVEERAIDIIVYMLLLEAFNSREWVSV